MNYRRQQENTHYARYLILAIFILVAAVRIIRLARFDIFYDEAMTVYEAVHWERFFTGRYWFYPPLSGMIHALWIHFFKSLFGIRLLEALFGLAGVAMAGRFANRLFEEKTALATLLIFGLSPFHIYYSREIRCYAIFSFVAILSWDIFLTVLRNPSYRTFIVFTLSTTALFYTNYFSIFIVLSQFTVIWFYHQPVKRKIQLSGCMIGAGILFLPWVSQMLWITDRILIKGQSIVPPTTWKTPFIISRALIAGYAPPEWSGNLFTVLLFAAVIIGFINRHNKQGLMFIGLFLLPFAYCLAVSLLFDFDFVWARYLIFLNFPLFIYAAAGMVSCRLPLRLSFIGIAVLFELYALNYQYRNVFHRISWDFCVRPRKEWYSSAAFIRDHLQPGDAIGHACNSSYYPYWFYNTFRNGVTQGEVLDIDGKHLTHLMELFPLPEQKDDYPDYPVDVDGFIAGAKRLWFVASEWDIDDPKSFDTHFARELKRYLDKRYPVIMYQNFYGAPVILYDLSTPLEGSNGNNAESSTQTDTGTENRAGNRVK
ncbi:glycosyltransferase family 39 protein [bacterium]|nr:glycosyltransferase family 39 protein [candidate division CSSED10-310 bacterium]